MIRIFSCLTAALLFAATAAFPCAKDGLPFAVPVMTQNDDGIGAMRFADMAKLVTYMTASGAPAGSYDRARAAGMKTIWYVDPHRIGDVPGKMSDRPPVTALDRDADLLRCAGGGTLDSTYSDRNGTYFGDPTSARLAARTNDQLRTAQAHYGTIDYLWKDDTMLPTDQWADAWFCGNTPPALLANRGNGMTAIGHGNPSGAHITYADRTPFAPQRFLTDLIAFDNRLAVPVLDEGACNGDGSDVGRDPDDGGATATVAARGRNAAGALCEDFAEGWGNAQTLDGKAVEHAWRTELNSGVEVISARKLFIVYPYIGNQGASNRGKPVDTDQRGYIYTSFMLIFERDLAVYKTGAWGATLKTAAPVMVLPENLLVPLDPLQTAHWPDRIGKLQRGGAYVREFRSCAYAGQAIGPCAAAVNPSASRTVELPAFEQRYGHSAVLTGNNGAFTGRHGTPDYGDTGDLAFTGRVPASLPPGGWVILGR